MRQLYFLLLLLTTSVSAQQVPFFSQFFYNKTLSNPGAAGSNGIPSLTAFHRQQWAGLEGAPVTQALSFNSPVLAGRVGLGLTLVKDNIGFFSSNYVQAAYAYRVPMAGGSLGIGLHGSMLRYEADLTEVRTISGSVVGVEQMMDFNHSFNMGLGAHFENERFFVGASVPYVLDRSQADGQVRHFFANAGALLELSPKLKMRAATAARLVENAPPSLDAHLGFGFMEDARLWLGGTLRMSKTEVAQEGGSLGGDAVVAAAHYQIGERLRVGLAFDASLGAVRRQNYGTFELMLEYRFVKIAPIVPVRHSRYF